jgi:hypothetical protein
MGMNRVSPLEMGIRGGEGWRAGRAIAGIAVIAEIGKNQNLPRRRGELPRSGDRKKQEPQPRAPPPQQAKIGLTGDPGLCHNSNDASNVPTLTPVVP